MMMDKGILEWFSKLLEKEKIEFRKKALIFSFFLGLSVLFWLMNALSENYTSDIDYPVRFKNYPENKTLIGDLPSELKIRVSAHGYALLRNRIGARHIPIIFNVRSFTLNRMSGRDSSFYYIESRYIHDYISRQLNSEFTIIDVKPDSLIFPFAEVIEKKLPVLNLTKYQLDKQLIFKSDIKLIPDSVMVTGPDYILDTLTIVSTENEDIGMISGSCEKNTVLKSMKHISFNKKNIKLVFEIEKFTEKLMSIPIEVLNEPDSLKLMTFPRSIQLSCIVGLSKFDFLQPQMFRAAVNYNSIIPGVSKIQVELNNRPEFVTGIKYKPKTVEFLIEK